MIFAEDAFGFERNWSQFRPCIDLHNGKVKQIVGGTLTDNDNDLTTNFVARQDAAYFAELYRKDNLTGGHVIKLGPGNEKAATQAIAAWPDGLHIGGGINQENARMWIERGAQKVIVTSWLFSDGQFSLDRLKSLSDYLGKEKIVVDLSCRRKQNSWFVATNRWQTITDFEVNQGNLLKCAEFSSEFLIHAADVEGLCKGIDEQLVKCLGVWSPIPCTYAGGAKDISDLELVNQLSGGKVDLTYGSALDIFGGNGVKYEDCVKWNKMHPPH